MIQDIQFFVRFSQLIGAVPYTLSTKEASDRQIVSLSFSWHSLPFIWFSLVTVWNVAILLIAGISMIDLTTQQASKTNATFILCSFSSQFLFILSSRLIVLQPRKWSRVVKLFTELARQTTNNFQSRRIKFEVIVIIVWVIVSEIVLLIAALPLVKGGIPDSSIAIYALVITSNYILYLNVQIPVWFVYFSYRIVGHNLRAASQLFISQKGATKHDNRYEKCVLLLNDVNTATEILNSIFSFPVFIMLCAAFSNAVLDLYLFITTFVKEDVFFFKARAAVGSIFLLNIVILLVILYAGEMPKQQVNYLRECIIRNQLNRHQLDFEFFKLCARKEALFNEKIEVSTILLQLKEERFRLSVLGLFDAGLHHIPALTGTVVTYLVIIFQQVSN